MADTEITREEAALILNDFDDALDALEEIIKGSDKLKNPLDSFGSGVDGQAAKERARKNGENVITHLEKLYDETKRRRDLAAAGFDELFGADFGSADNLQKIISQIPDNIVTNTDPPPHTPAPQDHAQNPPKNPGEK